MYTTVLSHSALLTCVRVTLETQFIVKGIPSWDAQLFAHKLKSCMLLKIYLISYFKSQKSNYPKIK